MSLFFIFLALYQNKAWFLMYHPFVAAYKGTKDSNSLVLTIRHNLKLLDQRYPKQLLQCLLNPNVRWIEDQVVHIRAQMAEFEPL